MLASASIDLPGPTSETPSRREILVVIVAGLLLYGFNPYFPLAGDAAVYADLVLQGRFNELTLHIGYYALLFAADRTIGALFSIPIHETAVGLNVVAGALVLGVAYLLALHFGHPPRRAPLSRGPRGERAHAGERDHRRDLHAADAVRAGVLLSLCPRARGSGRRGRWARDADVPPQRLRVSLLPRVRLSTGRSDQVERAAPADGRGSGGLPAVPHRVRQGAALGDPGLARHQQRDAGRSRGDAAQLSGLPVQGLHSPPPAADPRPLRAQDAPPVSRAHAGGSDSASLHHCQAGERGQRLHLQHGLLLRLLAGDRLAGAGEVLARPLDRPTAVARPCRVAADLGLDLPLRVGQGLRRRDAGHCRHLRHGGRTRSCSRIGPREWRSRCTVVARSRPCSSWSRSTSRCTTWTTNRGAVLSRSRPARSMCWTRGGPARSTACSAPRNRSRSRRARTPRCRGPSGG